MSDSDPEREPELGAMRFAGAGIELAGAVLALAAVGLLVDRYFGWETSWGFLVGAGIGFVLGMLNLFRLAMRYNR